MEDPLEESNNFFKSIPLPPPPPNDDGMDDDSCPYPRYDKMNTFQRLGCHKLNDTSLTAFYLHTIITDGISPKITRTGPRELHLLSFLKMVFFILGKFKRERFFYAIEIQWRRIVLSVFRLSRYKCQEIGFDSPLWAVMQNFGGCFELRETPSGWARKRRLFPPDPSLVRLAFEVTIRNVVLPACCGELILSDYDFWMLLRILKHLLGEIQISSSIHLLRVKYHGSFEDNFHSNLTDKEQAECEECDSAIHATQQLLGMIDLLIQCQEFPDGQHPLISKLLAGI